MIRLNLRINRLFIAIWCLSLWAFLAIFPPAYESYYPTRESRESFLAGMQQNTGMIAMWGPLESPATLGQIVVWEAGSFVLLLGSVMTVLLIVNLHRRAEHQGLTELQLSTGVARGAPAAAAIATVALVSLLVGAGAALVLWLSGFYVDDMPTSGAISFGATLTLTLIGSALLAQLVLLFVSNPAAVTRVALLTIAVSFIVRAVADNEGIDVLNWASPLGWKAITTPYVEDEFTSAAWLGVLCLAVAGVVLVGERYREYSRALLTMPEIRRPRTRRIRNLLHLSVVLNRGTVLVWTVVIAALSAFFIALTGSLSDWMETEADIGRVFDDLFAGDDLKTEFLAYVTKLCGMLVTIAGVQTVVSYRSSEQNRLVDLIRSTGVQRWTPLGSATTVAYLAIFLTTVGLMLGGLFGLWTQESTTNTDVENLIPAAWSQIAPAVLLTGVAVALAGMLPGLIQMSWAPIIVSAILTLFGPILQVPQWLIDLSPFEYVNLAEGGHWPLHTGMAVVGLILTATGLWGARQREIV